MKQRVGKWISGFVLIAGCIFFAACGEEEINDPLVSPFPSPISYAPDELGPDITFVPSMMKKVIYYTISDDMEKEEATAFFKSDVILTPQSLVQYVADSMEDVSLSVKILSVSSRDQSIIIDFDKSSVPVVDTEAELEVDVLDAIAQSVLENFDEYKNVIYRVNGEAYHSQNVSFELDYIYLEK